MNRCLICDSDMQVYIDEYGKKLKCVKCWYEE